MNRQIGVIAVFSLAISACLLSPTAHAAVPAGTSAPRTAAPPAAFVPAPITWGACANQGLGNAGAQCGFLTVPLDYSRPNGTMIRLAVSRIVHTSPDAQYQGVMLVNPGGPGGSGLILSALGQFVPNNGGDDYDWIGFDPRGVGSSVPALSCDGNYFSYNRPNYVPASKGVKNVWLARSKAYANACRTTGTKLLDHVKTIDTVMDMDSMRQALGAQQINYYGFSYGTYLGQVYSTMYPTRVRRMVLDGVVDPSRVWYPANLDQDVAFDRNIKIYFDWIARHDSVYHLGDTEPIVEALYYAVQARLAKGAAGGVIGPDEWNDIFVQAGYYVFGWEDVATAFTDAVHFGDWYPLQDLYDSASPQGPGADNGFAMYLATQCTDAAWPQAWGTWEADNQAVYTKAPFLTWNNVWFNAPCRNWSAKPGTPVTVDGTNSPPILLISETLDAATPYSGALAVRSRYPKSVLIEGVNGTTHAGSLFGVSCTDDTIASYLSTGALPARVAGNTSDLQCPPNPQPDPSADPAPGATASPGATATTAAGKSAAAAGKSAAASVNRLSRADLQRVIGWR